jgi:hypothetical protein
VGLFQHVETGRSSFLRESISGLVKQAMLFAGGIVDRDILSL